MIPVSPFRDLLRKYALGSRSLHFKTQKFQIQVCLGTHHGNTVANIDQSFKKLKLILVFSYNLRKGQKNLFSWGISASYHSMIPPRLFNVMIDSSHGTYARTLTFSLLLSQPVWLLVTRHDGFVHNSLTT